MLYPAVICAAAGGAHAESRWGDSGQLPLLSNRQGPQQELPDIAQGFLSLCVAHPEHGGKVTQGMYMDKHLKKMAWHQLSSSFSGFHVPQADD